MRLTFFVASFATLLGGCTMSGSKDAKGSAKATQTDIAVAPSANGDADRQTGGSGLPTGFAGRTDNPSSSAERISTSRPRLTRISSFVVPVSWR
jgi:hypothetical protein